MIPAVSYSGLIDPVSSLSGFGRVLGEIYPSTWFITAARGAFSKAFGMAELAGPMLAMGIAIPVIIGLAAAFLGVALFFVVRSFYGMRIEPGELEDEDEAHRQDGLLSPPATTPGLPAPRRNTAAQTS